MSNSPLISSIIPSSTAQQSLLLSPQFFQQTYQIFHESKSILNSADISQYILINYQPVRCNKRFPVFHPTADNSSNNTNVLQHSDVIQEQNLTNEFNVLLVSATEKLMKTSSIAHTTPHIIKKASNSKSSNTDANKTADGDIDLMPIGLNSIPTQKQLHR